MIAKKYKVLGHEVNYNVPTTSVEFNGLDPIRVAAGKDPACEEAVSNIVYRGMNPDTRFIFLHGQDAVEAKDGAEAQEAIEGVESIVAKLTEAVTLDEADTKDGNTFARKVVTLMKDGKPKLKDGVEITKFDEAEEQYYSRVLAMLVKYKVFNTEESARAHFDPLIKRIAEGVKFDPSAKERAERAPTKLAAKYKLAAAKALATGKVDNLNTKLFVQINKSFVPTNDATKIYTGKYPVKGADGQPDSEVDFSVSDVDAEALGKLVKEYQDWKASQELAEINA